MNMLSVYTHYCFTGIVAGVWPCGIITFLGEIYGSESKSQVYGLLHAFLHTNADTTAAIRENHSGILMIYTMNMIRITVGFVCYDDGCHLKKYAANSERKELTPSAR